MDWWWNKHNSNLIFEVDYIYNYVYSTIGRNVPIIAISKITEAINDKNFNLNNYDNKCCPLTQSYDKNFRINTDLLKNKNQNCIII